MIVCQELYLIGYFFNEKSELLELYKPAIHQFCIERLTNLAKANQVVIVIGLAEAVHDKLYNTAYVIDETGVIGKHRKINLTDNEAVFDPGEDVSIVHVKGINVGIAICFETWFPEMFRILAKKGADVICCPSNFGGPWTLDVIKVRALENNIPVILSNRIGSEDFDGVIDYFRGESMIVDEGGNIVLKAGSNPYLGVVDIDFKKINRNESIISKRMDLEQIKYKGIK